MARGRFISNAIMSDKKINELSDDTSRLAFTWLITEADCEGRVHGDPAMVRSLLFPRRTNITVEQMEAYINEWHNAEIIKWYRANGDLWIWFPNFEKYQIGLRKEREPVSQIPPLDDGELQPMTRIIDGKHPANIRQTSGTNKVKISKAKLREENGSGAENPPTPSKEKVTCPKEWMTALYELTGVNQSTASAGMRKRISEAGKALIESGSKLEDVERFGYWWLSDEWRKKNTPFPTPENIRDNWSKMNGNGSNHANTTRHTEPEYTPEELAQAERINADRHAREAEMRKV